MCELCLPLGFFYFRVLLSGNGMQYQRGVLAIEDSLRYFELCDFITGTARILIQVLFIKVSYGHDVRRGIESHCGFLGPLVFGGLSFFNLNLLHGDLLMNTSPIFRK